MAKGNLVVVESAAKARTVEKLLGRGYSVRACLGHVRDLPKSALGVDVEHDFAPKYLIPKEKKDVVKSLKGEAKTADTIYLATDPDREGEAIAWHIAQELDGKKQDAITASCSTRLRHGRLQQPCAIRVALMSTKSMPSKPAVFLTVS